MKILIDFETRSTVDLKKCGHQVYSEHPTTDIICMAWALNNGEPNLWLPFDTFPEDLQLAISSSWEIYAHNYSFDRAIWNNVAILKYGFPKIPDSQWRCSMALAYSMGLPGALEKAAIATGIDARKDMKASRIMQQISKPKGYDESGKPVWRNEDSKFQSTYQYCLNDLVVTQKLLEVLLPFSKLEVPVFELDRKINDRGILVDMPAIKTAIGIVESEKIRLDERMRDVTDGAVKACSEVGKLTAWVRNSGVEIPGVAKAAIEETLKTLNLPPSCRQALLLRQESAKASTAKLEAMQARAGADNRVRGAFQYCGANTHRWAGRGAQLQNLPRVSLLTQHQIEEVLDGLSENTITATDIDAFYGPPMAALSDCIRGFLKAAPGKKFLAGDYSAIEARVLAWLAGEEKVLNIFRGHGKIYEAAASDIFNVAINKVTSEQRQIGKTAMLACGFGGGIGAFQKMAINYGVKVSDEKAEVIKTRWREANKKIVRYWYDLDTAARMAIKNSGDKFQVGHQGRQVIFLKKGSFLICKLPSARVLFYPYPKIEEVETPWGEKKFAVTYKAENSQTRQWETQKTFPGFWSENVTQSVSRDLLAEAMLRLDREGWDIVLHSHDEIVCEQMPSTKFSVKELERIMAINPPWVKELPIEAKGWEGERYRK